MTEKNHAIENAKGWWANICEMMNALEDAGDDDAARGAAEQRISESILSVEVRGGWQAPCVEGMGPEEYRILLTFGGPALQLCGELGEHCEPITAELQYQDWFQPWTAAFPELEVEWESYKATLLAFASQFWYGE